MRWKWAQLLIPKKRRIRGAKGWVRRTVVRTNWRGRFGHWRRTLGQPKQWRKVSRSCRGGVPGLSATATLEIVSCGGENGGGPFGFFARAANFNEVDIPVEGRFEAGLLLRPGAIARETRHINEWLAPFATGRVWPIGLRALARRCECTLRVSRADLAATLPTRGACLRGLARREGRSLHAPTSACLKNCAPLLVIAFNPQSSVPAFAPPAKGLLKLLKFSH